MSTSAGSLRSVDVTLGSAPRPASVVTRRSRRASEFTWATSTVPSRQSSAWVTRRGPTCSASSSPRSAAQARAWASKGSASTRVSSLPCQTKASSSTWTKSGCPASTPESPGGSATSMRALTSRSGSPSVFRSLTGWDLASLSLAAISGRPEPTRWAANASHSPSRQPGSGRTAVAGRFPLSPPNWAPSLSSKYA